MQVKGHPVVGGLEDHPGGILGMLITAHGGKVGPAGEAGDAPGHIMLLHPAHVGQGGQVFQLLPGEAPEMVLFIGVIPRIGRVGGRIGEEEPVFQPVVIGLRQQLILLVQEVHIAVVLPVIPVILPLGHGVVKEVIQEEEGGRGDEQQSHGGLHRASEQHAQGR